MTRAQITCSQCRVARSEREWSALPSVAQVAGADLEGVVSRWPEQLVVVVRACPCGATIARLAPRCTSAAIA